MVEEVSLERDQGEEEEVYLVMVPEEDCWERDPGLEETVGDCQEEEVPGHPRVAASNNRSRVVTTLGPLSTMARRQLQQRALVIDNSNSKDSHSRET